MILQNSSGRSLIYWISRAEPWRGGAERLRRPVQLLKSSFHIRPVCRGAFTGAGRDAAVELACWRCSGSFQSLPSLTGKSIPARIIIGSYTKRY